jgi:hypothetical protein
MTQILEQRDAILSRRSLLGRGALVGAATGAVALGLSPALRSDVSAFAQDDATPEGGEPENGGFEDDVAVLNYALTLEHLEFAFYRDNVDAYDLGTTASATPSTPTSASSATTRAPTSRP